MLARVMKLNYYGFINKTQLYTTTKTIYTTDTF